MWDENTYMGIGPLRSHGLCIGVLTGLSAEPEDRELCQKENFLKLQIQSLYVYVFGVS